MGPLDGLKIIEIAGIGPGQLCGMLLADMGAQVVRIQRISDLDVGLPLPARFDLMNRSRPSITVDLKQSAGVRLVLDLCDRADAIFEGFRPGVMERLGLGPDECCARNERLVYGRMTGWGQSGPLAGTVGHDANYAAISGALGAIGTPDSGPVIPLNLVADFAGGALYLALGILAAMLEARTSGQGQVVDAAMVDGAASLMTLFYGLHAGGLWRDRRAANFLDGAAPFYRCYATQDKQYIVVCAIERRFFRALLDTLEIDAIAPDDQFNQASWPEHRRIFGDIFRGKTRDEWVDLFEATDACVAPVLSLREAPAHPHNQARATFQTVDGIPQPAPAPRFSRTATAIGGPPDVPGTRNRQTLLAWGFSEAEIEHLLETGALGPQPAD